MAEHNITGQKGEQMAADFLEKNGYKILETNWRFMNLEADIIAEKSKILVIAEVKTRKSNYFGEPESFVTKQKQKNLIKTANAYIERKQLDRKQPNCRSNCRQQKSIANTSRRRHRLL